MSKTFLYIFFIVGSTGGWLFIVRLLFEMRKLSKLREIERDLQMKAMTFEELEQAMEENGLIVEKGKFKRRGL